MKSNDLSLNALMHTAKDLKMQSVFGRKFVHFESGQTKYFKQKIGAIDKVQAPE